MADTSEHGSPRPSCEANPNDESPDPLSEIWEWYIVLRDEQPVEPADLTDEDLERLWVVSQGLLHLHNLGRYGSHTDDGAEVSA